MKSIKTTNEAAHYCRLKSNGAIDDKCEKQCGNCKKALIVKTQSGKKGYVYYDDNDDLKSQKLQVKIIDEKFKETGENLLCSPSKLTAIGYKD